LLKGCKGLIGIFRALFPAPMERAQADVAALSFPKAKKAYIVNTLDPVLEQMVQELLDTQPEDPVTHMITWLRRRCNAPASSHCRESVKVQNEALKKELGSTQNFVEEVSMCVGQSKSKEDDDASEEEDDDVEDEPAPPPPDNRMKKARQSVSAEAYGAWNVKKEFTPPQYPKPEEQTNKLKRILGASWLFSSLDDKDLGVIVLAMKDESFEPGARILTEGDDGDFLFVIEQGSPLCKKKIDGEEKVVKTCQPGDVFGELALLYNCPRAASVEAADKALCWKLDRETFNHIVKDSATKRIREYDEFLKNVSLFISMDAYERSQLCDALVPETHNKGDFIVKQDEPGNKFYILAEGALVAHKNDTQVMEYAVGDYFGELALLKSQPRAASVLVTSNTAKVLSLDRKSFHKMLGPLEGILTRRTYA